MQWATAVSEIPITERAAHGVAAEISASLHSAPDLVLVFFSNHHRAEAMAISAILRDAFDEPLLLGCSGGGVIADQELEDRPGLAVVAACLPDVSLHPFHLADSDLVHFVAGLERWEDLLGIANSEDPAFVLLSEPFSCDVSPFLHSLDQAYPTSAKIGGLVSGGNEPGNHLLIYNDHIYDEGLLGLALGGNIRLDTVVAQGCRPIGEPMFVTRAEQYLLQGLDGETPLDVLRQLYSGLGSRDRELIGQALFLGIAMPKANQAYRQGDFLIRNIVGVDAEQGAMAVAAPLQENGIVQFHIRDARTSRDDLAALLGQFQGQSSHQGALLFSCLGRGAGLYGIPNHDTALIHEHLGEIPIGGFFANGEIGPVQGRTYLHGYTSVLGLFSPRDQAS